jgi:hypothetical protein
MKYPATFSVILIASFFITTSSDADEVMSAQFRAMAACLSGIKTSSGQQLKVVTDKPHEVSGFLSNGKGFGCQKKESGTQGTYFEGWYMGD